MPRKAASSKTREKVRTRSASKNKKKSLDVLENEQESSRSKLRSDARDTRGGSGAKIPSSSSARTSRSMAKAGKKSLSNPEQSKSIDKSRPKSSSKVGSGFRDDLGSSRQRAIMLSKQKGVGEKRPIHMIRPSKMRDASSSGDESESEELVHHKSKVLRRNTSRSGMQYTTEKEMKRTPGTRGRINTSFSKQDYRSKRILNRRKKRTPRSKDVTSPERLRNFLSDYERDEIFDDDPSRLFRNDQAPQGQQQNVAPVPEDEYAGNEDVLDQYVTDRLNLNLPELPIFPNPPDPLPFQATYNDPGSLFDSHPSANNVGQDEIGSQRQVYGLLSDILHNGTPTSGALQDQHGRIPPSFEYPPSNQQRAGPSSAAQQLRLRMPPAVEEPLNARTQATYVSHETPVVSLWVGIFAGVGDGASSLDVFNGLNFTIILEAEDRGGEAQRFDFTEHNFGTCRIVKLSTRLASALQVNPIGRFFPVDVPVAKSARRDTVYYCTLSFPPNHVTPTNQNGLVFPQKLRFCTRLVKRVSGKDHKSPLAFHPFLEGQYLYRLSVCRKVHSICMFIMKGAAIWFPRSFGQQPVKKLPRGHNDTLQNWLDNDPMLAICRKTMDPMVSFLRHVRPKFVENTVDGGRPKRMDNKDLLTSRRACVDLMRIQNEFFDAPKPRRAYILQHGERFPALLLLKRQEIGDLLNVQATWLSQHFKECGLPAWPGKMFSPNAAKLRRKLIRLHIATQYIVSVVAASVNHGVKLEFPPISFYRVRRLRRKIRAYRRARRRFINKGGDKSLVDSGDSMDDVPELGKLDYQDENGAVLDPESDVDFEPYIGEKESQVTLSMTEVRYFTEDFLDPWNDLPKREQDFILDPMWESVLPWRNIPLDPNDIKRTPVENQDDKWFPMEQGIKYGKLQSLPTGKSGPQSPAVDLTSIIRSFGWQDSDTDDSATEGMHSRADGIAQPEYKTFVPDSRQGAGRNFVLGGKARRAPRSKCTRGRGGRYMTGYAVKAAKEKTEQVEGADRLAQRLRLDLMEAYPKLHYMIPQVVARYPHDTAQ